LTTFGDARYKVVRMADMVERLITIIFLMAVAANSLAALPPHRDGEGGCGAECCEAARHDGPVATISGICCITECPQPAETARSAAASIELKPQQLSGPAAGFLSTSNQASYLQHARFPDSPTRFLHGSSSRYLDTGSLLI
jgi:hypothetical protein